MKCYFHGDDCWLNRADASPDPGMKEVLKDLEVQKPEEKPKPQPEPVGHIPPSKPGSATTFKDAFTKWYGTYRYHFGLITTDTLEYINNAYERALEVQGEAERCKKFCNILDEKRLEIEERNTILNERIRTGALTGDDIEIRVHNAEQSSFTALFNTFGCRRWLGMLSDGDDEISADLRIPLNPHAQFLRRCTTFCENITDDDDSRCECLDLWTEYLENKKTLDEVRNAVVEKFGKEAYEHARKKVLEIHGEVPNISIPECD